ncbi:MAG TPA: hypothetical protein VK966_13820, partial [Longimicrobiales bacterium]|nr:hypothetical protein [Longimicrobiales bacterium]
HASAAAIYEGGFIVTEETTVFDENGVWQPLGEPLGYMELHNRAMEMFDEFIAIAEANPELVFERPWIASEAMTLEDMIPVAHSFKARYMSQVARTPAERDALDWGAIIEEAEAGLFTPGEAWEQDVSYIRTNWSSYPGGYYMGINFSAWQQVPYFYIGMADPDGGDYLDWLELPVFQRNARIDMDDDGAVEPVTIVTPDLRFPQGETLAEQQDDWRTRGAGGPQVFSATQTQAHVNPARGTWRWSYYSAELPYEQWISITAPVYHVNARETRLIAAEGYLRQGDAGAAADIIDETRVAVAGLDPSGDGNDMCVPRLPNGECGDLFEMLKWEKRMEVWGQGTLNSTWFFDSRGWGDLYHNTFLHLPVPAAEAQLLGLDDPYHTHGGGEGASAGVSTYQFPHEG